MKNIKILISLLLLLSFMACEIAEPPVPYRYSNKAIFTWGFAQFYGDYYANYNTQNNVVVVNLFSEDLQLVDGKLEGTGHYLVLPDIFMSPTDTLLPTGSYVVAESREPFTFFPGKEFLDNREKVSSGAYVYFVERDPAQSKIAYVTSGNLDVTAVNDSIYDLKVNFVLDEKDEFTATFKGVLYHLDESVKD